MLFPTFFNLSLNVAIRSSWSEPQSASGLVFADCIELLHLWLQRIYQSDFGVDDLVMSCVESSVMLLEEGVFYDLCVPLAKRKKKSLCPASFYTHRPNLPVTPGIS